jgi:peptidyl-prolyl cis-trans isomerase SurA
MRWFFGLCLLCLVAGAAPAQETRIAAVVNDDVVTLDDVTARLNLVMRSSGIPDNPQNRQRLAGQVLRALVDEKLQRQEAKRLNITVSEEEVKQGFQRLERQNNMPAGSLETFLAQNGIPRSSLVDQLTASIAWGKVVRNRLTQDVTISDEEVNEAMARLKENIGQPQSRVSEIFLAVDSPAQEEEVKSLADRLIAQVRSGANFAAVAQQFSQSPSAAVGGDIGWVQANQLGDLLGKAVSKMAPGEMSYPIRTGAGYYVLYVVDRRTLGSANADDTTLSLRQVVFPLASTAGAAERQQAEQQAQAVAQQAKSCGEMARLGEERAPQTSGALELRAGDLPPELRRIVLGLKVAEPSQPLPVRGGIGVVMVCERREPTSGLPTREEVLDTLGRERLDALARRYMRDLRRSAFVDIRA